MKTAHAISVAATAITRGPRLKTIALALASIWGTLSIAHAESTVYGAFDVGMVKVKNQTLAIGRGDNNKLGFKGVEELSQGLSATYQFEMRFEPDTGTTEAAPNRPLFQGESRVGLKGNWGHFLIGRGLSPLQEQATVGQFEPWNMVSNRGNLLNFYVAGFNGDPLNPGSSQNRLNNGLFYMSPKLEGIQFNYARSTKEAQGNGTPKETPQAINLVYDNNGPITATIGAERNAIGSTLKNAAVAYRFAGLNDLKVSTSYAINSPVTGRQIKGNTIGLQMPLGQGKILAGYGRNKPDGLDTTTQSSLGYQHHLSKDTYLYIDGWRRRAPNVTDVTGFSFGAHHDFSSSGSSPVSLWNSLNAKTGQSSFTIYGVADAGIQFGANGVSDPSSKVASGIAEGSHLGFKGVEALSNGYKVGFNLEARVVLDTGKQSNGNISNSQGRALTSGMEALGPKLLPVVQTFLQPTVNTNTNNAIFDRNSTIDILTPYGEVHAGRQYTPAYDILGMSDTFELGTAGSWKNIFGGNGGILNTGIAVRSDKSLRYEISRNGLATTIMYGAKNSGYLGLDDRFFGANLTYKSGPLELGIGHNHGQDQSNKEGLVTTIFGGSYTIGDLKFIAGIQSMRNSNSVLIPVFTSAWDANIAPTLKPLGASTTKALRQVFTSNLAKNFELDANGASFGIQYRIGSGRVMGSVSVLNDKTTFNNDATQFALGYDHMINKNIDIYSVVGYIKNHAGAQFAPGTADAPGGFTASPGESGKAIQVGVRRRF